MVRPLPVWVKTAAMSCSDGSEEVSWKRARTWTFDGGGAGKTKWPPPL